MKSRLFHNFFLSAFILLATASLSCDRKDERPFYALVNGERIYEDEVLDSELVAQIQALEAEILKLKAQKTESLIQKRLLSQQSKRLGITEEEILRPFESLRGASVSPEEMERVKKHLGQFEASGDSKSASWTQVLEDVKEGRVVEARRRFLAELRSRATVKNLLIEPGTENRHNPPD